MQLRLDHVSKRYGRDTWALRECSLELDGGLTGVLGRNGAGKSTLLRILATVTRPTRGLVKWNDVDLVRSPDEVRRVLGYLPQDVGVYPHLTAGEFLAYLAALKGMSYRMSRPRIAELLEALDLVQVRHRPLSAYSGGMRQRVGVAQALLNDPALLILDEPTAGLDPEERIWFRALLSQLSAERVVIVSTHIISDLADIAGQLAILDRGLLRMHASPGQMLSQVRGRIWDLLTSEAELERLRGQLVVSRVVRAADSLHVRVISAEPPCADAVAAEPTLEDAYLALMRNVAEAPGPLSTP